MKRKGVWYLRVLGSACLGCQEILAPGIHAFHFQFFSLYPGNGEYPGLSLTSQWKATDLFGGATAIKFLLEIWLLDDKQMWTCIPVLITGCGLKKLVSGEWDPVENY